VAAFPHRLDYPGHFLAGFGGTLLLLAALLSLAPRPLGWAAVWVALVAIGIGAITESTIFRFAIFDPVDFCNQSLGAGLAALSVLDRPASRGSAWLLAGLSGVLLIAGWQLAFA
jgi:hypothetical protein